MPGEFAKRFKNGQAQHKIVTEITESNIHTDILEYIKSLNDNSIFDNDLFKYNISLPNEGDNMDLIYIQCPSDKSADKLHLL